MNSIEMMLLNCTEQERHELNIIMGNACEEFNGIRKGHYEIEFFTDNLDIRSPVEQAVQSIYSAVQYGVSGLKSFIETAGVYGTVAMGNVSEYVADYLDGEDNTDQVDVSEVISKDAPLGEVIEPMTSEESKEQTDIAVEEKLETPNEEPINHSEETHASNEGVSEVKKEDEQEVHEEHPPVEENTPEENQSTS